MLIQLLKLYSYILIGSELLYSKYIDQVLWTNDYDLKSQGKMVKFVDIHPIGDRKFIETISLHSTILSKG